MVSLLKFLEEFKEMELVEVHITYDARLGREDKKWLNVIIRTVEIK